MSCMLISIVKRNFQPTQIELSTLISLSQRGGRGGNGCGGGRFGGVSDDQDRLNCEHCGTCQGYMLGSLWLSPRFLVSYFS